MSRRPSIVVLTHTSCHRFFIEEVCMSRRFSDEPINLIHRIPTPDQLLEAARPSKRSWGQAMMESVSAWAKSTLAAIRQRAGSGGVNYRTTAGSGASYDAGPKTHASERSACPAVQSEPVHRAEVSGAAVQPEEVAELRAYILSQQQDIARLSAQLQEVKSMVLSQQQVLLYMGKELEAAPAPMTGVASAPAKRSRALRDKPYSKEKAAPRQDLQNPSLSL
jgi:DNA-binding PucR family transcriptional regulator